MALMIQHFDQHSILCVVGDAVFFLKATVKFTSKKHHQYTFGKFSLAVIMCIIVWSRLVALCSSLVVGKDRFPPGQVTVLVFWNKCWEAVQCFWFGEKHISQRTQ